MTFGSCLNDDDDFPYRPMASSGLPTILRFFKLKSTDGPSKSTDGPSIWKLSNLPQIDIVEQTGHKEGFGPQFHLFQDKKHKRLWIALPGARPTKSCISSDWPSLGNIGDTLYPHGVDLLDLNEIKIPRKSSIMDSNYMRKQPHQWFDLGSKFNPMDISSNYDPFYEYDNAKFRYNYTLEPSHYGEYAFLVPFKPTFKNLSIQESVQKQMRKNERKFRDGQNAMHKQNYQKHLDQQRNIGNLPGRRELYPNNLPPLQSKQQVGMDEKGSASKKGPTLVKKPFRVNPRFITGE